jgi:hypothetical protein
MGADLYLTRVREKHKEKYELQFSKWVTIRDAAKTKAERDAAQQKVRHHWKLMSDKTYFRDSYNDSNLLWLFGLSWWQHVGDLLDAEGRLMPDDAALLLRWLADREDTFGEHLAALTPGEGETKEQAQQYFREKYASLQAFLYEAIQRDEPVSCWI